MGTNRVIIDCYTDEPAGLGVPPFLGVWPRYVAGKYRDLPRYMTIDDLRIANLDRAPKERKLYPRHGKTRKDLINFTRDYEEILEILKWSEQLIFIAGLQTPGKYLSAKPGNIKEILKLTEKYPKKSKILTGPAASMGTQQYGGKLAEKIPEREFNSVRPFNYSNYDQLQKYAIEGAEIFEELPHNRRVIEIETGRGCFREQGCSFCTEPFKHNAEWRPYKHIIREVEKFQEMGAQAFRLGKQSCLYSYQNGNTEKLKQLLQGLNRNSPEVLHFDNANPLMVNRERTEIIVDNMTPGSTAAMGIESFDEKVIKQNNLNSDFDKTVEAIEIINDIGGERGENGNPKLLPGINILLGLKGESKSTLEKNFQALKEIMEQDLLFRRVNIRKVVPFPNTPLAEEVGESVLHSNKRYYKKWIKKVRDKIDSPMLKKIYPRGTILKGLYSEINHGNNTFLRQLGSYPIVVGVEKRLPIGKKFDVKVVGHNPRSLTGEII